MTHKQNMLNLGFVNTALSYQQRGILFLSATNSNIKGLSSLECNEIDFQRDAYINLLKSPDHSKYAPHLPFISRAFSRKTKRHYLVFKYSESFMQVLNYHQPVCC